MGGGPGRSLGKTFGNSLTTGISSSLFSICDLVKGFTVVTRDDQVFTVDWITSSGWPFVSAVLGQMAHLVTSITLNSPRSCFMSSVLLWLVIIVAVVGVDVTVVVVIESSSVVKLSFVIT
ncbi:hypothetical protein Tco_1563022 [Tanacetum coccineum]